MIMPISQIKEILSAGANLVVDASMFTLNDLKQLAGEAANANVSIMVKNVSSITHEHLKQIALIAPARVTYDLT